MTDQELDEKIRVYVQNNWCINDEDMLRRAAEINKNVLEIDPETGKFKLEQKNKQPEYKKETEMNIIQSGNQFRFNTNSVNIIHELPVAVYSVAADMGGLFLVKSDMAKTTGPVYGDGPAKLEKIIASFSKTERNLGVILSGDKGIGKTMFTRMTMERVLKEGMPVIMVNDYFDGLADFIGGLDFPCSVVFDEFDKNFSSNSKNALDSTACQTTLLTLFDGVHPGHKLFIVTCNDIGRVSEFLVNRPGRFRYHIRFEYPDEASVRQYLKDNVGEKLREDDVEYIVKFSALVPLTYDCLAAIASELREGETFSSAMKMLNIVNLNSESRYNISVEIVANDQKLTANLDYGETFNIFNDQPSAENPNVYRISIYNDDLNKVLGIESAGDSLDYRGGAFRKVDLGQVAFSEKDLRKHAKFSKDSLIIDGGKIRVVWDKEIKTNDEDDGNRLAPWMVTHNKFLKLNPAVTKITLSPAYSHTVGHYDVSHL